MLSSNGQRLDVFSLPAGDVGLTRREELTILVEGTPKSMSVADYYPDAEGKLLRVRLVRIGSGLNGGTLIYLEDLGRAQSEAQQMKLAAMGRLTASIAHEVRNPLSAINQAAQLLEAKSEILKLRAELRRAEEERDILKKAARYFASQPE